MRTISTDLPQEWWSNFYYYIHNKTGKVVTFDLVKETLQEFGGTFRMNIDVPQGLIYYIDFETDEDATAFVLRWS